MYFRNALITLFLACSWINPSHAQSAIAGTEEAPVFSICREIMVSEQLLGADHESIQFSLLKALSVDYPIFFGTHFTRNLVYYTKSLFSEYIPESETNHMHTKWGDTYWNKKGIKALGPILREQRNNPKVQGRLARVANEVWERLVSLDDHNLLYYYPALKKTQVDDSKALLNFIETTQFKKNVLDLITSLVLNSDQWAPGLMSVDGVSILKSDSNQSVKDTLIYRFRRKSVIKSFLENKNLINLPVHAKLGKDLQLITPTRLRLDLSKVMKQFETETPSPQSYIKGIQEFNVFTLTETEAFQDDPILNKFSETAENWLLASKKPLNETAPKAAFIEAYVKMHELQDARVSMLKTLQAASLKAERAIKIHPEFEKRSAILSELELIQTNLQEWQNQMNLVESILALMGSEASHRWFYVQDQTLFKKNIDMFSTFFTK